MREAAVDAANLYAVPATRSTGVTHFQDLMGEYVYLTLSRTALALGL